MLCIFVPDGKGQKVIHDTHVSTCHARILAQGEQRPPFLAPK